MMKHKYKILIFLCIVFMILPSYATAQGKLSDQSQLCLRCHSNKELKKPLESKEWLSLYVNGETFANSVHNPFNCGGCHTGISMANHPRPQKIASKKEYAANTSRSCKMCHPDAVLMKKPMHGKAATQAKGPACSECHAPHSIKRIAEWKAGMTDQQYCLTCHRHDLSMTLASGEVYPLIVDEAAFKGSAHGGLSCSICHMGFSKKDHPTKVFKTRKEYSASYSKSCRMCHPDAVIMKKPMHGKAVTQVKAPACSECHTSHAIKRIKDLKAAISESQYCLMCHRHSLTMPLKSGEHLALFVDERLISKSVHGKLPCSNCHEGFSKDIHPLRVYKNKREYSSIMGGTCKKCHAEADKLYTGSIHDIVLKEGNLKAPSCTDCHGFHTVVKATTDRNFGLLSCAKCHGEENNAYEKSIHNTARIKEKENAPVCSSCHRAHDVKVTAMTMKMKEVCLTCHKNADKAHKKWLSNPPFKLSSFAGYHLEKVSCSTCHAPDARGGIFLVMNDKKTGKPFPEQEVLRLLATDAAGLQKQLNPDGKGAGSSE
ncbi:MAG: hypothetical protein FJ243_00705, partial [Nitrospira sp.]|nr:hypothetical protein [Nitrospira sp.]